MKVVIIGSGMAGTGLALALRKAAPSFQATIITSEKRGHYSRPLLSHGISRDDIEQRIMLKSFEQLRADGITVHAGAEVDGIDREKRVVSFNTGSPGETRVQYDRLVLATGSEAFIPPPWLEHREHFWTLNQLEDLSGIRSLRTEMLSNGKTPAWAIIGGGLIGCEVASDVRKAGDPVHLLHAADRLMERQLDQAQSKRLYEHLLGSGIRIDVDMKIASFSGDGEGKRIQMTDGTFFGGYDIVLVATGFRPRVALAKNAGLGVSSGIVTDEYLRTNDHAVFALGDVAQIGGKQNYAFVAPIRDQVSWLAGFLTGQQQEAWVPPLFKPVAKIHGFKA